jgi:glycerol-3-phosphate dehydrogenase subunit B
MTFDTIIIGGGHSGLQQGVALQKSGQQCLIISTGESSRRFRDPEWSQDIERHRFEDLGGVWLEDRVLRGDFEVTNEGDLLCRIYTEKRGEESLVADQFILATGSFYSGGLVADPVRIVEPVFGLDVYYEGGHKDWVRPDFFAPQPFMTFGVCLDAEGRALRAGRSVLNLQAVGSVVCARDARHA